MNIYSRIVTTAASGLLLGSLVTPNFAQAKDTNSGQSVPANESFTPTQEGSLKLPGSSSAESAAKNCFSSIKSQPMPLPGQTQRSSQNFSLKGVKKFQVRVFQNGKLNNNIRFNIKLDRRLRPDPIVGSNIGTSTYTYTGDTYPLYIASPQGAGQSSFKVKFCKVN